MKRVVLQWFTSAALLALIQPVFAESVSVSAACEAKRAEIEMQLARATAQGRDHQIAGLERALAANKANCTQEQLELQRAQDIQEAQEKVAEREQELKEAQDKAEASKIAEKKKKLEEAQKKLKEAQAPLPK